MFRETGNMQFFLIKIKSYFNSQKKNPPPHDRRDTFSYYINLYKSHNIAQERSLRKTNLYNGENVPKRILCFKTIELSFFLYALNHDDINQRKK